MRIYLFIMLSFCTLEQFAQNGEVDRSASLRSELERIHDADQQARHQIANLPAGSERDSLLKVIVRNDAENRIRVFAILDSVGWLSEDQIGRKANQTLFLVVQHSDADPGSQEYYLGMMREAVAEGKARAAELAMLEDRVAVNKGEEQIYGSQIGYKDGRSFIHPIRDEAHVNERRKAVGLGSLEEYAAQFGIEWKAPAPDERVVPPPGLQRSR